MNTKVSECSCLTFFFRLTLAFRLIFSPRSVFEASLISKTLIPQLSPNHHLHRIYLVEKRGRCLFVWLFLAYSLVEPWGVIDSFAILAVSPSPSYNSCHSFWQVKSFLGTSSLSTIFQQLLLSHWWIDFNAHEAPINPCDEALLFASSSEVIIVPIIEQDSTIFLERKMSWNLCR